MPGSKIGEKDKFVIIPQAKTNKKQNGQPDDYNEQILNLTKFGLSIDQYNKMQVMTPE